MTTELEAPARPVRRTPPPAEKKGTSTDRCLTLDAYRGLTMLFMVSSGLSMGHLLTANLPDSLPNRVLLFAADQLRHREWDMTFRVNAGFPSWDSQGFHDGTGCTPWDLIQPSFMFIVGAAMPFAFARRRERGKSWRQEFLHVLRRCLLLVLIGIFLDTYAERVLYIQFIRVLQQIAIGYFIAFFFLHLRPRWQAVGAAGLLAVHGLAYLLYGLATKGYPWVQKPDDALWEQTHNFGWAIENWVHQVASLGVYYTVLPLSKGHYVTFNAVSSAATILFGVVAGELLRKDWPGGRKVLLLAAAGVAGIALGLALSPVIPVNKKIWSASFALFAGGCTSLLLAGFYWVIDVLEFRRWTFPFVVVGLNSIAIYVTAGTLGENFKRLWQSFLGVPFSHLPPEAVPIVLAALVVLANWLLCYWLYRRRIFFKV
jgi:heparan-alpha-glucosaminide N-acetyltransferase